MAVGHERWCRGVTDCIVHMICLRMHFILKQPILVLWHVKYAPCTNYAKFCIKVIGTFVKDLAFWPCSVHLLATTYSISNSFVIRLVHFRLWPDVFYARVCKIHVFILYMIFIAGYCLHWNILNNFQDHQTADVCRLCWRWTASRVGGSLWPTSGSLLHRPH